VPTPTSRTPTIAPMAGAPAALADAPADRRRRWVLAAAATGVMITAPAVVSKAAELPAGWRDEARANLPYAAFVGAWQDPDATSLVSPRPTTDRPLIASAPLTPTPPSEVAADEPAEEEPADLGALPDGVVELARHEEIVVAAEGAHVELVGFHESASGGALELASAHPVVSSHPNVTAQVPDGDGPVVVLPPRHRAGSPTSAIDLSVVAGSPVVAPISGEVVEVAEYTLYGTTRDLLIQIRSSEDPGVVAHVHHLEGAVVAVGDHVEAGTTVLATEARQLPFESQIDRYTVAHRGQATPHVHIELRPG
jgi:biotin carboxyl carrier protein